jgi:hypothetical protein
MRLKALVAALSVAVGVAFTAGSVAVSAQAGSSDRDKADAQKSVSTPSRLATLDGVKAVRMDPRDMEAVKGLHIHFTTPSQNDGHPLVDDATGWHFVNHRENNLGNGQALSISGPGYSGLCGAALVSGAITIPGQDTTTGSGGGC